MQPQITFQRDGRGCSLLQNVRRNVDKRWTTLGDERRRQFRARAIGHVKRAAVRVENARRAFDDQAMQIIGPDRFPKRFAEAVQKIEDERFLDLDLFFRTLQHADAARCRAPCKTQPASGRNEQPEKKNRPHVGPASLLRRCLVMKVLF